MFKKSVCILLFAALSALTVGCAGGSDTASSTASKAAAIGDEIQVECSDEEWVTENGEGNFSVPFVNALCEGAYAVNGEIEQLYEKISNGENGYISSKFSFAVYKAMLSVNITVTNKYTQNEYYVYNLELENGTVPTSTEIGEYLGYDENRYNETVKQFCQAAFDYKYTGFENNLPGYSSLLEKTTSKENIAAAQPFVTKKGELGAIVTIYDVDDGSHLQRVTLVNGQTEFE